MEAKQGCRQAVPQEDADEKNKVQKIQTPPPGIEPGTCRLTADRSANGALEALDEPRGI